MNSIEQIKAVIIMLVRARLVENKTSSEQSLIITGDSVLSELISSLDVISLMVELERLYNIEVTDEDLVTFNSIDELVQIIYEKMDSFGV